MNSQLPEIKKTLEVLKPGLSSKYAVNSIGLFGSVVRDDFNAKSDIDIIVDFTRPVGIEFIDLADELENKLHRKVDIVSKNGIKEKYFPANKTRDHLCLTVSPNICWKIY